MNPSIAPAYLSLRNNQRQLDADGCEVGISRQALDEVLDAFIVSSTELDWPDALGCFWNAALGAAHERQDSTAFSMASIMVQGVAAVSQRLQEQKDEAVEVIDWKGRAEKAEASLKDIGDFAHDRSTGPAVPDDLWEIRRMAYDL